MKEFAINQLSSLSGLAFNQNILFTVSDEFYSLVATDLKTQVYFEFDAPKNQRIRNLSYIERKKVKPDFESLSVIHHQNRTYLHIMPSLSKANRHCGYLVQLDLEVKTPAKELFLEIKPLNYEPLLKELTTEERELNIEGHLFHDDKLLLFNRGNLKSPSQLFYMTYDFNTYQAKLERAVNVDLGAYEGYPIQWTDALWKNAQSIYFSATVEKVDNAVDDGQVLASFIGEYHLEQNKVISLSKIIEFEKIEGLCRINDELAFCVDPDKEGNHGKIFYGFKL